MPLPVNLRARGKIQTAVTTPVFRTFASADMDTCGLQEDCVSSPVDITTNLMITFIVNERQQLSLSAFVMLQFSNLNSHRKTAYLVHVTVFSLIMFFVSVDFFPKYKCTLPAWSVFLSNSDRARTQDSPSSRSTSRSVRRLVYSRFLPSSVPISELPMDLFGGMHSMPRNRESLHRACSTTAPCLQNHWD